MGKAGKIEHDKHFMVVRTRLKHWNAYHQCIPTWEEIHEFYVLSEEIHLCDMRVMSVIVNEKWFSEFCLKEDYYAQEKIRIISTTLRTCAISGGYLNAYNWVYRCDINKLWVWDIFNKSLGYFESIHGSKKTWSLDITKQYTSVSKSISNSPKNYKKMLAQAIKEQEEK